MNICDEKHLPKYKIVYKGAKKSNYNSIWFVCSNCLETKRYFYDENEIIKITRIKSSQTNLN